MIKVISLDLWGTLIKGNKLYSEERAKLVAEKTGIKNLELVSSVIKSVKNELYAAVDNTGVHFNKRYVYSVILSKLNAHPYPKLVTDIITGGDDLFCKHPPALISPVWIDLLKSWQGKYEIYCVSNTMMIDGVVIRKAMKRINIYDYFTGSIFSDECKVSKPDPNIYTRLLFDTCVAPRKSATTV
jgi:FMN phosphatase YigB (HAD superfamily)